MHVTCPLMILQFSNIVINAVYGNSYGLTDCYVNSKAAARILFN